MEPWARHIRAQGHTVHCPTLAGNRPEDDRATTGLQDAARSLSDFLERMDLTEVRLVAHSYGGMVISQVAVMLPYPIWRKAFINNADAGLAESSYAMLNPQPYGTFTEPVSLGTELAALEVGKSYLNFQQDTAMPHGFPWQPRLSERLGLFRLVEAQGDHEVCFTNPALAAQKVIEAGRD